MKKRIISLGANTKYADNVTQNPQMQSYTDLTAGFNIEMRKEIHPQIKNQNLLFY
jgi:hypothetical protein